MDLSERNIHILKGLRDLVGSNYNRIVSISGALRKFFNEYGYSIIDTPLLENTELFIRKSGGAMTSRLYTFTDPGGQKVSLRPEFTSSVIRYFLGNKDSINLPVRFQYAGPVFRYETATPGNYRQFNQVGAELVGSIKDEASDDAEMIGLALDGLKQINIDQYSLRIGHIGVLSELLDTFALSEAAKLLIVGNIKEIKTESNSVDNLTKRAETMGLLRKGSNSNDLYDARESKDQASHEYILNILKNSMPKSLGQRTREQILTRLLRKTSGEDSPKDFEDAVKLIREVTQLEGMPKTVFKQLRGIQEKRGITTSALNNISATLEILCSQGIPSERITLDLGLVRDIAYYTGVIFELNYLSKGVHVLIGGGGRYNGLVKALGNPTDIPALGFAYNLDRILAVIDTPNTPVTE